jgi:sugar transferase (PEP-CTERM/EpsH1 system associated)
VAPVSVTAVDPRPLVAHLVYRFDTGGLENGVVNLLNHLPAASWRHVVMAMTEVAPEFSRRVHTADVRYIALDKTPGHGAWLYPRLWRLLRELRPAVFHTRNLAALECQPAAALAGVPVRIHGEHGRDVEDLDGSSVRHQRIRRVYRPFVHHYIALSRELQGYLEQKVHVPPSRIAQVYNGVDIQRFHPRRDTRLRPEGCPFGDPDHWLIGTVGRMQTVKDQTMLARAFVLALQQRPALRPRLRLVMVGEGPLRARSQAILGEAGMADLAWLPGERADVPEIMRELDAFALPSLAEGISNTVLEAMACRLPVIATRVGGNAELLEEGVTGLLVPAAEPEAMAQALISLASNPAHAAAMGQAGRQRCVERFSLQSMVGAYDALYCRLLAQAA